jgi:Predicted membrane protein
MRKNMNRNSKGRIEIKKLAVIAVAAALLITAAFIYKNDTGYGKSARDTAAKAAVTDSDIIIQAKDVTDKPSFYPAVINGTNLEVIAVKASDGTIRTAFNTCQVCYNSGKGYYKVEGSELVCQNCGNRFGANDIETVKGGCNPVPITDEYKTVSNDTITIPKTILSQAVTIFQNWK